MNQVTIHLLSERIKIWLKSHFKDSYDIKQIPGDASNRYYFRIYYGQQTFILMVSESKTSALNFVQSTHCLRSFNIPCPNIIASKDEFSVILLEDLGTDRLLENLHSDNADAWYHQAMEILTYLPVQLDDIPTMDYQHLFDESNLAWQWYFTLEKNLIDDDYDLFAEPLKWLCHEISSLPYAVAHKDFHAGNLMITQNTLRVIDYQDYCMAPVGYDLISLIKDCYIDWPEKNILTWINQFYSMNNLELSIEEFTKAVTLIGLQRHMKCLGIFTRLKHRDEKPEYMNHIPRLIRYLEKAISMFPELRTWQDILKKAVTCTQ